MFQYLGGGGGGGEVVIVQSAELTGICGHRHVHLHLFVSQVEVADPKQKVVKLGAIRVGQTVKRSIPIVNRSPAPIAFNLGFTSSTPALQEKGVITYKPQSEINLAPHGGTQKVRLHVVLSVLIFGLYLQIAQVVHPVLCKWAFNLGNLCSNKEIQLHRLL